MIESPGYQLTEVLHEGTATVVCGSSEVWDWLTVLKASQASASEIIPDKLLQKEVNRTNSARKCCSGGSTGEKG
jgi:hypothetical protein